MKLLVLFVMILNICLCAFIAQRAEASESLSSCFMNLGQGDYNAMYSEAQFEAINYPRAQDAPAPGTVPDHRVFYGYLYPNASSCSLAVLSDDGVNVTLDGNLVLKNFNKGQMLPDLAHSLCPITPYTAVVGTPNVIQIDYSNIVYNGAFDIDGLTLLAYNGGAQVSPAPIAVVSIQDQLGAAHYTNAPVSTGTLTIPSGTSVSFRALNNSSSPINWPTGITPTWTISLTTGATLTSTPATSAGPSIANVNFTAPGSYQLTASYNSSSVTTSITVIDPTSIVVSYTSLPAICAGGGTESVHTGIVKVNATAGGIGVSNVTIGLDFDTPVKQYCQTTPNATLPTFGNITVTTDSNGNAQTTITSGSAVFPAPFHCPVAQAILTLNGIVQANSKTPIQVTAPVVTCKAYNTGTPIPVSDWDTDGFGIDLVGNITYTDAAQVSTNISSHTASWYFKFFDHDPAIDGVTPQYDTNYKFDGVVSEVDPQDVDGYTLYGQISDVANEISENGNGSYNAFFETGTTAGRIYWFMSDTSVIVDQNN